MSSTSITLKNEHGDNFCQIDAGDIDWHNNEARQFAIQNPDQIVVLETYEETLRREGIDITHKETGEPIGIPRLLARPTAALCLEAQERREQAKRRFA